MIGYSQQIVRFNREADSQMLGVRLGRYCILRDIPVKDVMSYFGVSKQTVYNWFVGKHIPAKRHYVEIKRFMSQVAS